MSHLSSAAILLAHGLLGWALCGAVMGLGLAFTSLTTALWVHLVAAPLIFVALSWLYYRRFSPAAPLAVAATFTALVGALDVFVVALLIERSFAMFASVMGTWLPFALIFGATWLTGRWMRRAA